MATDTEMKGLVPVHRQPEYQPGPLVSNNDQCALASRGALGLAVVVAASSTL